jgi:hypothetical protein
VSALEFSDGVVATNALTVLFGTLPHFPVVRSVWRSLDKAVSKLTEEGGGGEIIGADVKTIAIR